MIRSTRPMLAASWALSLERSNPRGFSPSSQPHAPGSSPRSLGQRPRCARMLAWVDRGCNRAEEPSVMDGSKGEVVSANNRPLGLLSLGEVPKSVHSACSWDASSQPDPSERSPSRANLVAASSLTRGLSASYAPSTLSHSGTCQEKARRASPVANARSEGESLAQHSSAASRAREDRSD
jgi:hypothetical protein